MGISVASGSGILCFYRVGMRDWQGETERDTGFQFQRNVMTNAKPEAGENEPFVRIYSCMCLVSIYE